MLIYAVVSPVKDEQEYVIRTLASVTGQTVPPAKWVIVDDGSTDNTPQIIRDYAQRFPWILLLRLERDGARDLGVTEIRAFSEGCKLLADGDFDLIVKLDCDLELPSDYFESLIGEFERRPRLGIASGVYLENHDGAWAPVAMPPYHAAGASKVLRRGCFNDIGGFVLHRGWDTIDEIKALAGGWETMHFPYIQFHHLRCEGGAIGSRRTNLLHGEVYYRTGGGPTFLALKVLHRCLMGRPFLLGGLTMLWGYILCGLRRKPRAVSPNEIKLYRRMLNGRITGLLLQHVRTIRLAVTVRGRN